MENGMNKGMRQVHGRFCNKTDMIDYANAVVEFVQEAMGANWEFDLSENARQGLVIILGLVNKINLGHNRLQGGDYEAFILS